MLTVELNEGATDWPKLLEALESGAETEITIARDGKPTVVMTAVPASPVTATPGERPKRRLGLLEGKVKFDYEAFQALDADVQKLFEECADPFGEKLDR